MKTFTQAILFLSLGALTAAVDWEANIQDINAVEAGHNFDGNQVNTLTDGGYRRKLEGNFGVSDDEDEWDNDDRELERYSDDDEDYEDYDDEEDDEEEDEDGRELEGYQMDSVIEQDQEDAASFLRSPARDLKGKKKRYGGKKKHYHKKHHRDLGRFKKGGKKKGYNKKYKGKGYKKYKGHKKYKKY